jgi:hypothetical protein
MKNRPKPKRRPLLVDEFLATKMVPWPDKQEERLILAVRNNLREAKKFVLDDKAAVYAAEMIRDHPIAIAHDQEFAIPCFPRMYIELPYPNFFETLGGNNPHDPIMGDTEVGYFIDGPRAYVLSRVWNGPENAEMRKKLGCQAMMMPLAYTLNQPMTLEQELDVCQRAHVSRMGIDILYWGSSYEKLPHSERVALRANHGFEHWYAKDVDDLITPMFTSAAGDLRNIIALTLFLNRTNEVRFEEQIGPAQGFVHAKPTTLVRHSVVRLKLDPKPLFKKLYGHGGVWRREHDCRGHFCHDKITREHNHEHDWREYDVNQWRCMTCGGLKWWRKAHRRGHREKGVVNTSYEVTR